MPMMDSAEKKCNKIVRKKEKKISENIPKVAVHEDVSYETCH